MPGIPVYTHYNTSNACPDITLKQLKIETRRIPDGILLP